MSDELLHVSTRFARNYVDAQARRISEELGVSVVGDYGMSPFSGITDDGAESGDGSIRFGAAGLAFSISNGFGFGAIEDVTFVGTLVSLYHERRHSAVFQDLSLGLASDSLLFAHMAKQGSNDYYVVNRYRFATEIDAEYHGVMDTYWVLASSFGDELANGLICKYVNYQCGNFDYYVDAPAFGSFDSILQIEDAFFDAYELSTSIEPVERDSNGIPFESRCYKQVFANSSKRDVIGQFVTSRGVLRPECRPVFDAIWDAGNGNKDRMMASLSLHFMPKLRSFYGDAVCDALSLEQVFGTEIARCVPSSESTGVESRCIEPIGGSFLSDDGKQGGGFEMSV